MFDEKFALRCTELGLLVYWIFAALVAMNVIVVDPSLMYSDYKNPAVIAWNWSFLPLDLIFILIGLGRWASGSTNPMLKVIELTLMFCAGFMAISFWSLQGFFDPSWWGLNLWLMLLPSIILYRNAQKMRLRRQ